MAVRNITAGIVFALLIAFCTVCGCAAHNLSVEEMNGNVGITAHSKSTTMAAANFELDEGDTIYVDGDLKNGSVDLVITSAYSGENVFSGTVSGQEKSDVVADPGKYTISIVANEATGSVAIYDRAA